MGLIGGIARTAVVAGTATAVSNRVSRRQARRWGGQEYADQAQYGQPPGYGQPQYADPPPAPAPTPAPAAATSQVSAELTRLGELHSQGLLTDEEFSAAKAKLLGIG